METEHGTHWKYPLTPPRLSLTANASTDAISSSSSSCLAKKETGRVYFFFFLISVQLFTLRRTTGSSFFFFSFSSYSHQDLIWKQQQQFLFKYVISIYFYIFFFTFIGGAGLMNLPSLPTGPPPQGSAAPSAPLSNSQGSPPLAPTVVKAAASGALVCFVWKPFSQMNCIDNRNIPFN